MSKLKAENGWPCDNLFIDCAKVLTKNGYEFAVMNEHSGGMISLAQPLTMKTVPKEEIGMYSQEPTFFLDQKAAVRLMDSMWNAGIRPSQYTGPGEVDALKNHLKDMRDIAFSFIELKK